MRASLPIFAEKKPPWIKVKAPSGARFYAMKERARRLSLATVCEEARCPNIAECWGQEHSTATFMLMGELCTRGCRFCAVTTQRHPPPLDPLEPENIATAVDELEARYVVITSVNRDDLPDGGSSHLLACLEAVKERCPEVLLEILAPDFLGEPSAVQRVAGAPIAVFAHNLETVARLTPQVRDPRASYRQSLGVLELAKAARPALVTKSSLMLGLRETEAEVIQTMADLRSVGVDVLTLGQYLRPSGKHLEVAEYLVPEKFVALAERAKTMGFLYVAAGPLVRSSYRAAELYLAGHLAGAQRKVGHHEPS